ncbi:hypothetical protein Taro_034025, partial [Colocasia esculenta]|nr:hypothetical protein [Colocasia esculenta]
MVRGGRSGRVSTSVGRGDCLPIHVGRLGDRDRLPIHASRPGDRDRLPDSTSSVTFPIPITTRGKIDPSFASHYITTLVHAHIPGPVDSWKEFPTSVRELLFDMFMRHEHERAPTFRELFDRTHKRKGTDDYVSESARTIVETYDRTMTDCYADGTPHPNLDPEAWVDAAGELRKGRVYGFGDILDTTPMMSSYTSSVAPPPYASSSATPPGSGGEDMRTLIEEELQTQFGVMVEQLISAMQGVRPSHHAPQ